MVTITDPPAIPAGYAELRVRRVAGESALVSSYGNSPLKILAPQPRGRSVWAYLSSFGGGVVAGDRTSLEVTLEPETRAYIGTQSATKIYRNPGQKPSGHTTRAVVGSGSLLVMAPDPVQAFAGSSYRQDQEFRLAAGASLVLVDGVTAGRSARAERWEFDFFQSRNEVWMADAGAGADGDGHRIFLDAVTLQTSPGGLTLLQRLGRFNCLATVLLLGPSVGDLAEEILGYFQTQPVGCRTSFVASASPVAGGVLLRLAAVEVEVVTGEVRRLLAPLATLLGDNPWARKW